MGTSGTDAIVAYSGKEEEEEEEEEYYELEHLPPLLEDEENVSLADILSLRDGCLSDEDVWAVCMECVLALKSIGPSALFHTLCITPDTLAFNAHGNVCFMEQLSDDPEGSFVPPEFDQTGCTFEGHVYSLGSTLSAALDFVIEPELEAELGEEPRRLLDQMQEEDPEDRPRPQDIVSLAEAKLAHTSSAAVCRKLSSIGRRVLSIESVAAFQDGLEGCWEARWQQPKTNQPLRQTASEDGGEERETPESNGLSRRRVCGAWDSSLWADGAGEEEEEEGVDPLGEDPFGPQSDCRSQNSSPVRRRPQERGGRARGALNRSCSVPDSNNPPPPPLPAAPHGDISVPVSDLTEIGAEGGGAAAAVWSNGPRGGGRSARERAGQRGSSPPDYETSEGEEEEEACASAASGSGTNQSGAWRSSQDSSRDTETASLDPASEEAAANDHRYVLTNHMTKSMLCLNEESQDEWISLRELLTSCGRRLSVNELWALCHTCLSTLQTYIDYPAYLCLDTVYVGCEGEVLFLKPKNTGSCDSFFLAPEFQQHGIVTEKACVYGVAAILWATAKFSLTPNQKLAVPRRLKRLLLEMAKGAPIERPSIVMAKKSCRDYLSRQGTNAEAVWTKLISRVHQPHSKALDADDHNGVHSNESTPNMSGFVPTATESRLAPVPGPLPHSYPISRSLRLPEAFTSPATHFTPIVLTRELDPEEDAPPPPSDQQGTADEFTSDGRHAHNEDLDAATHLEAPPLSQEERHLQPDRHGDGPRNSSSSASSGRTLVNSPPPASPELSNHETRVPPPLLSSTCSHHAGCGAFNSFLLRQDLQTGCLTLVPVHISAPEPVPGLDFSLPLASGCLRGSPPPQTHPVCPEDPGSDRATVTPRDPTTLCQEPGLPRPRLDPSHPGSSLGPPSDPRRLVSEPGGEDSPAEISSSPGIHPALQEVIALLRGEFAFDGYLENGEEDLAMGEYIFSLKGLHYPTFASVVQERFSDLYWEEDLLGVLHCLVNYSPSPPGSNEQAPSKPQQRAATSLLRAGRRGEREALLRGRLDPDHADPGGPQAWERTEAEGKKAGLSHRVTEAVPEHRDSELRTTGPGKQTRRAISVELHHYGRQGPGVSSTRRRAAGVMESAAHPAGGGVDESLSEAASPPWEEEEEGEGGPPAAGGERGQMSLDCQADMEDTDSLASERLLSPGSGPEEPGPRLSPAWALAFYGEERFSQEVVRYAAGLGQHADAACLEHKTQELQQQLMIETRNLKKTRNFYQRLLHQERKNKGSETKLMLSKLKVQLEELRSKVDFLDYVKKYLEVLSVDEWGVEASLLPSLAASGHASLELQASEEPAVLSFGTGREKTSLQAGSPAGLMAYLYARNAPLEGYIQQFLYTYRYFCTPEELLQFLMDRFNSAVGGGSDMVGDHAKVYHRSLDLLAAWLTSDCRLVDFSPKSSLLTTLENFLTSAVPAVDSRGESLLAALHSSPNKRRGQGSGSPISMQDDDDSLSVHSLCRKSSIEDPGRKSFQWRISRMVEPQASLPKEKSYSIAAALPRPCYTSLMDDLSSACLRSQERYPFSQSTHSAPQAAQQLTLLQQEVFQGCHPVHFLNSRAQGVRDKAASKNVSHHVCPAEGSSLFVSEVTAQDSRLLQLLSYADSVTNWVSAEIVICDSVKAQAALLTKFLLIAKHCYESRNFATAMQVLGGLENVIVRQLPAWKHLSAKVCEILEELRAVQVFLKSDNLCLMEGEPVRRRPALPSAHILAMHLQQLEIGAFTLTSGAYKWPKLRTIARVVSQVHAFQESVFCYGVDLELQAYLRLRIAHLGACDLHLLAADNDANFHQPHMERHTRRIQDTLRRVKATFQ